MTDNSRDRRDGQSCGGRSAGGRSTGRSQDTGRSGGRPDRGRGPRDSDRDRQARDRNDRTGNDRRSQDRTGQDRRSQDRTGQDRRSYDRAGEDRRSQDRDGYDRRNRDRNDRDRPATRGTVRLDEPAIPDEVTAADLDPEVRRDLLSLDKANAEKVARHLIMVMNLLGEDPAAALAHARAARDRAGRVGVVRETAGIAAYTAGEWQEALSELRTARRLTGSTALLPLIADSERGLGRPERAIDLARSADGRALTGDVATEMLIVESGARLDMGEPGKAVVTLQAADLKPGQTGDAPARLFYAYATALLAAGRRDEAVTWFMNAASADVEDITDAELRLVELAEGDETTDVEPAEEVPVSGAAAESVAPSSVEGDAESAEASSDAGQAEVAGPSVEPAVGVEAESEVEVSAGGAAEPIDALSSGVAPSDDSAASAEVAVAVVPDESAGVSTRSARSTSGGDVAGAAGGGDVVGAAGGGDSGGDVVGSTSGGDSGGDVVGSTSGGDVGSAAGVGAETDEATVVASLASGYDALLLDLDGTVFTGSEPLPGAVQALATVGVPAYYVTNNASRRAPDVAAHLVDLGFDAVADQVVTSAQAGARMLAQQLRPGSRALVVGTDGLAQEVREVGIGVTRSADDRPDAVIQGHSPTTDWAILSEAVLAINNGALWVACNVDPTLPSERGFMIGNGSMVAAVANATGKQPQVAGKPAAPLMADAIERSASTHPLVVGDRLDTDIEGAVTVGVDSALVLTGVTTATDLLVAIPEQRPTYVVDDLRGLLADADTARIGAQPGWTVSAELTDGELDVAITASDDAVDAGLLPALTAAVWAAVDTQTDQSDEGIAVTIATSDDRVRALLDALGVR